MEQLTHSQLLLLDNLVYLKNVTKNPARFTVAAVVNYYYKNGELTPDFIKDQQSKEDGTYPTLMDLTEWKQVLSNISKDKRLMDLKIENGIDDDDALPGYGTDKSPGGLCAAFFVEPEMKSDGKYDATFVIRGTNGSVEWNDNAMSVYAGFSTQGVRPHLYTYVHIRLKI